MLKQLMLRKKLAQKRVELEAITVMRSEIEKRNADVGVAVEEAKTDEEFAALDAEIASIDADVAANEVEKSKLEGEIEGIEKEILELKNNEPKASEPKVEERQQKTTEGEVRMSRLKFFRNEAHNELVTREDVKEFAVRVRGFIGEKRSVTGTDLLIPEVMLELLRDNLHRYSKLIAKVRIKPVKGIARQNVTGSIPEGIWMEAVGKLNELALSFSQFEVDGYKVGGFIPVPNATLEDSDINLMDEIMDALGQAIGYAVDKAIVYGTGVKMPTGIAVRLSEAAEPSYWGANEKAWTDLRTTNILKFASAAMTAEAFFSALVLKLAVAKPNYSTGEAFWVMNRATKMSIISKAVTLNAAGAIVAGVSNTMPIVGGEIIELEFMADGDILGGFGSLYLLVERAGASLAVSEHVKFIEDQTVFKGTARYDGRPVFGEGFVIVNINNVAPKVAETFAADAANF